MLKFNKIIVVFNFFVFTTLSLFIMNTSIAKPTLRTAYFHLPPHMLKVAGDNNPQGALIEYFEKHIAPAMEIKINWIGPYDSFKRLSSDALNNHFDMASMITSFPASQKIYNFTKTPFKKGKHTLALLSSRKLNRIKSQQDLFGLKIAHFSVEKSFYLNIFKNKKIKIQDVTGRYWFKRAMKMLVHNRVDAVYAPEEEPFYFNIYTQKTGLKIKLLHLPIKENVFYTVFNKNLKKSKNYVTKYDRALKKYKVSYQEYLNNYLKNRRDKDRKMGYFASAN